MYRDRTSDSMENLKQFAKQKTRKILLNSPYISNASNTKTLKRMHNINNDKTRDEKQEKGRNLRLKLGRTENGKRQEQRIDIDKTAYKNKVRVESEWSRRGQRPI